MMKVVIGDIGRKAKKRRRCTLTAIRHVKGRSLNLSLRDKASRTVRTFVLRCSFPLHHNQCAKWIISRPLPSRACSTRLLEPLIATILDDFYKP